MAAASRADSHGFARAQRRPAEGSPARGFGSRERSDTRPRGPLPRGFGRYPSLTSFLHNRICERSSNGMAVASRADLHGFARAQRRPAEGSPAKGFRPIPVSHIFIQTQLNLREIVEWYGGRFPSRFAWVRASAATPGRGVPCQGVSADTRLSHFYPTQLNLRESPNGMASASQADSRGFDSRLSLQKREAFLGFSFLESCIRIEPQAHACYDLRQWHVLRLSVRARRALRPRGANSRRSLFPQAHAKHGSTAAACPASVGSGSKSLAPLRRKLPSFACSGAIRL